MARIYILEAGGGASNINGVSPQFAMTKMDDEHHPECEVYVEDNRGKVFLSEILSRHGKEIFVRCAIIPFGAANLGVALGQMVAANRFPRPTRVFLDGDQEESEGCLLLPGTAAPEREVFGRLREAGWRNIGNRIGRDIAPVTDACERAITRPDHHEWLESAANDLMCGSDVLWQAMCSEWSEMAETADVQYIVDSIEDALQRIGERPQRRALR